MIELERRLVHIEKSITQWEDRVSRLMKQHGRIEADFALEDWEREEILYDIGEDIVETRDHVKEMKEQLNTVWKEYQDEKRNRASNQSRES